MTVLSVFRSLKPMAALQQMSRMGSKKIVPTVAVPTRSLFLSAIKNGGHHSNTMNITASRYNYQQYKDVLHFYILLGVIPLSILVFFVNVFIGPATLTEIPEGYVPKQYELYPHPITRWLAHYWYEDQQEVYERNLHYMVEEEEGRTMSALEKRIDKLMRERGDYPVFYQNKITLGKYLRGHIDEGWSNKFNVKGDM